MTSWQSLLNGSSARWHEGALVGFADSDDEITTALTADAVAPLPGLGVIEATGADAGAFLQAQLSNDVLSLADGGSRLAAYCNPKGRMLALFRVIRAGGGFLLLLPRPLLEPLVKRLRMFVLRSKVSLTDASERYLALGLVGDGAAQRLADLSLPAEPDDGLWRGSAGIWRLRGERPRALLLAAADAAEALWTALQGMAPVGEPAWRLLDVRAGVPDILPGAQENIIPQMANLDLLDGISFTKGCYPGQEIVARMHYLGNLKRRMYRLVVDGADLPAPGTDVRDAAGALAGEIVMAAPGPEQRTEALAVLQIDRAAATDLQVAGRAVQQVQPPPYLR